MLQRCHQPVQRHPRAFAPHNVSHLQSRRVQRGARRFTCNASSGLAGCRLVGVGSSVPPTRLTNNELAELVDTTDDWIATRTGISSRHVIGEGESISQHAAEACKKALEMANVDAKDVDMILMATSTPDDMFGSAGKVQAAIGAKNAVAFDLTAACSGFVLALITAAMYVRTGTAKRVLIIGADVLSKFVDWSDRSTCILFGDGCGALLIEAAPEGVGCSLLGLDMHSDGAGNPQLNCNIQQGGGAKHASEAPGGLSSYANIHMNGREVFKFAVRSVPTVISAALQKANLTTNDVDWLVMHQANQRILDAAAERLGLPAEKVVSNVAEYGNTSAASIPIALDEAVRSGAIKPGHTIAMAGFGAGLTWASAIVRWG